jgi:hypothetical protein
MRGRIGELERRDTRDVRSEAGAAEKKNSPRHSSIFGLLFLNFVFVLYTKLASSLRSFHGFERAGTVACS